MAEDGGLVNKLLGKNKKKKYTDRHTFTVSGTKFIVDRKYSPIKPVGTGAYGVVW
jgi:hypothetical protein